LLRITDRPIRTHTSAIRTHTSAAYAILHLLRITDRPIRTHTPAYARIRAGQRHTPFEAHTPLLPEPHTPFLQSLIRNCEAHTPLLQRLIRRCCRASYAVLDCCGLRQHTSAYVRPLL
jgi:hypothetical protein